MMEELKPCPFCGGEAGIVHGDLGRNGSRVICKSCGGSTDFFCISTRYSSDKKAADAWNAREDEKDAPY